MQKSSTLTNRGLKNITHALTAMHFVASVFMAKSQEHALAEQVLSVQLTKTIPFLQGLRSRDT